MCCPHCVSTGWLFSRVARNYRRRFQKKGFEPCQRQLFAAILRLAPNNASVLEIGCGVGHFHQSLLEQGCASAIGIDASDKMIAEASRWAAERGLGERVRYYCGDFVEIHDRMAPGDITILDKVICCYPNSEELLRVSGQKTNQLMALIYPKDAWYIRLGIRMAGLLMRLVGSNFRPYFYPPAQVEGWITAHGFRKAAESQTFLWLSQVYIRAE